MENKEVYIFKCNSMLKPEDAERIRKELQRQVDTGVVLHSPRVDFIARQQVKSGIEIEVELIPERAAPYTMEQLEEMRAGAGGLCAVVMVSDLEHPENEDVSAILDWDFKQSELVAVWGYGVEPYRARDYMTKWAAFPHIKQDVK
jgi:hypothetical protein|nr:MAG TPA: hypothetical protein [Caudoviricetes sp.]